MALYLDKLLEGSSIVCSLLIECNFVREVQLPQLAIDEPVIRNYKPSASISAEVCLALFSMPQILVFYLESGGSHGSEDRVHRSSQL